MPCEPLGGADGAEGEAAAAVRVVAEFEDIVGAGGGDDVFAFGVAYAVRGDLDVASGCAAWMISCNVIAVPEGASSLDL